MIVKLRDSLFAELVLEGDGIYSGMNKNISGQSLEKAMREKVADRNYHDYLETISENHSIPVMDHEVKNFISNLPKYSIILDIGGCWGWHWRNLEAIRPDINVVIIDFVRANLIHAKNVLGDFVGRKIWLVHADAKDLPFKINKTFKGFNAVWTVQTFQHIPDFEAVMNESFRVLCDEGYFANYSLHNTPFNRFVYYCLNKNFHKKGEVKGSYYLERANQDQLNIISNIFGKQNILERFTENLFHPDLKLKFTGKENSRLAILDIFISRFSFFAKLIARQRGTLAKKVIN